MAPDDVLAQEGAGSPGVGEASSEIGRYVGVAVLFPVVECHVEGLPLGVVGVSGDVRGTKAGLGVGFLHASHFLDWSISQGLGKVACWVIPVMGSKRRASPNQISR